MLRYKSPLSFLRPMPLQVNLMLLIVVDTPPCVNTDTFKPGLQVKSVFVHSDNAHCSGWAFDAVITKAGPLALHTMAR